MRDPKLDNMFQQGSGSQSVFDLPRYVPLTLRLKILFSGALVWFGYVFFGFGMIFVWIFGGSAALNSLVFFSGDLTEAQAEITQITETNMTINERKVVDCHYQFQIDDTQHSDSTSAYQGQYSVDKKVTIEYVTSEPSRSRIKDLTLMSPMFMFIPMIFPVVGLTIVIIGIRKSLKGIWLLRNGKMGAGVLVSKEATNTSINKQRVYKYTFDFTADDGNTYQAIAKTHDHSKFAGETDLEDAEHLEGIVEPLFYEPYNPSRVMMRDDIPGGIKFNDYGELQGSIVSLCFNLILPVVVIIGHGYWFLHVIEVL
ncbi:MAG: hypothetical protein COA78_29730 [Blastopirellula sp.]|nr:MAG: hypothetical protein COA78_29730 [Blastopirellula sp.]